MRAPAAGVDTDRVDQLLVRARREIDDGLLPSCQIALAKDGEIVLFETFGDATPSTRYTIFSATKAFVASAVWILLQDGSLDLNARVTDVVPEFGANGKDRITIEQVMLHTSGFPSPVMNPLRWDDREARLARFARWKLEYEPGTRYIYHPTSAHWVMAELIERVSGQDFRVFLRERVVEPLGLPGFKLGVPIEEQRDNAEVVLVGEEMTPDEMKEAFGVRAFPSTEADTQNLPNLNNPAARVVGMPGAGGIATAADLALFYQALLHNEAAIWDEAFLRDATGRVRNNLPDPLQGVPAYRGLGVVIAGDDGKANMRGFGHTNSPRAFGHNGAGGQIAWGDPGTGLSFGYVTNGIDRHRLRMGRRGVGLSSRAAVCAE